MRIYRRKTRETVNRFLSHGGPSQILISKNYEVVMVDDGKTIRLRPLHSPFLDLNSLHVCMESGPRVKRL